MSNVTAKRRVKVYSFAPRCSQTKHCGLNIGISRTAAELYQLEHVNAVAPVSGVHVKPAATIANIKHTAPSTTPSAKRIDALESGMEK